MNNKDIYNESKEQIKKQNNLSKIEVKDKIVKDKKIKKRLFFLKLFTIIFILLICAITIFVIFILKKGKKDKREIKIEEEENEENENIINIDDINNKPPLTKKNNSLTAIYLLEEGKEAILFNPEKIDLSEKNYKIEILSRNNNQKNSTTIMRVLEEINYKYMPDSSGKFEIMISFNIVLTSISELFKNCKNLIEIDLSSLEGSNLKSLDSTFEGCENLENANLTLKDGNNITSMANSFSGCSNLKEVDLTDLKPKFNINIQFMFKDCLNLNFVDLSNFNTFNFQGIFKGCINLKIYDISNFNDYNNETTISLNDIFNSIKEKLNLTCEIGENSKCKTCQKGLFLSHYCEKCNEGYYIPYQKRRKECLKCNNNCLACFGSETFQYCYKCEEGYYLNEGNCIKKCEIGNDNKCNSCDLKEQHLCQTCNEGYFLPEDDRTQCKICGLENCKECEGNSNYTKCSKCEEDYILSGNKCLKYCEINQETQCKKCNNEEEKIDQCLECNKGYYLPEDNITHCQKCSIENCEICENNNCSKCFDNYLIKYENDTIISCYMEIPERIDIIKKEFPERIDIIKKGILTEGVIEILNDNASKTQLNNSIKYYFEGSGTVPYTSYWWKSLSGNCELQVYFNISNLLPDNVYYLQDNYYLYLNGSIKYEADNGASYAEFSANQMFFGFWGEEWGCNWMNCFYSGHFGAYANLEKVKHNGKIYIGGVYNRGFINGYHYISLDGFNYITTLGNGTGNIGWTFSFGIGQYSSGTIKFRYTFKISDLFLIRKKD